MDTTTIAVKLTTRAAVKQLAAVLEVQLNRHVTINEVIVLAVTAFSEQIKNGETKP